MKLKAAMIGLFVILSVSLVGIPGLLRAQETMSKDCPMHAQKMEGKCCDSEMCKKMQVHRENMKNMVDRIGEHISQMENQKDMNELRTAIKKLKVQVEELRTQMASYPVHCLKEMEKKEGAKE